MVILETIYIFHKKEKKIIPKNLNFNVKVVSNKIRFDTYLKQRYEMKHVFKVELRLNVNKFSYVTQL